MKLTNLPIWPRILAAKPRKTAARSAIGILRAVVANGGLRQAGPETRTANYHQYYTGIELIDLWCERSVTSARGFEGLPGRKTHHPVAKRQFSQAVRDERRSLHDKQFARTLARRQAAAKLHRDLVMHIAERYHATVRALYRSRYAGIVWSASAKENVEWDRYAKSYKFPCKYSDAGAIANEQCITLSPTSGNGVYLPLVPAKLQKAWLPKASHPIGLFATRTTDADVSACWSPAKYSHDSKWVCVGFAIRGVSVPQWVAAREQITVELIADEQNTEVRRIAIERFGLEKYIAAAGASLVHQDEFGALYDTDGLRTVKVTNSTPEPDGTHKDYFLRVPPSCSTAREAVAWTFGQKTEAYAPSAQS